MPDKAMGFRAEPAVVHWATVSRGDNGYVLEEHAAIKAPKDLSEGATLTWLRARLKTLIEEQVPEVAAIKYTEQKAQSRYADSARRRVRMEGVLLQLLNERGLDIVTGAYRAMAGHLGAKSSKQYLKEPTLRGLDWTGVPEVRRDAILVAVAALED